MCKNRRAIQHVFRSSLINTYINAYLTVAVICTVLFSLFGGKREGKIQRTRESQYWRAVNNPNKLLVC